MSKITIEKEQEVLKLYLDLEKKLSTTKIGKIFNISSTSVTNIVKRNGFIPRGNSESKKGIKRGSLLPHKKIINLYKNGYTSFEISKKIGCSKRSVLNVLHENNIKLRNPGWSENYLNPLTKKIKKIYLSGKSIKYVMNETKLSYGCINRILKKLKIIRSEDVRKSMKGKKHTISTKNKVRETRQRKKELGLYDHIYLKKTGLTYDEYQKKLPELEKYLQKVKRITMSQPIESLSNFKKRGKAGEKGAYNIDHKYSISEGFKNKVPPEIIGHIKNLEMIPWKKNVKKQANCSITLKELKKQIKEYNLLNK